MCFTDFLFFTDFSTEQNLSIHLSRWISFPKCFVVIWWSKEGIIYQKVLISFIKHIIASVYCQHLGKLKQKLLYKLATPHATLTTRKKLLNFISSSTYTGAFFFGPSSFSIVSEFLGPLNIGRCASCKDSIISTVSIVNQWDFIGRNYSTARYRIQQMVSYYANA